jgi:sulfate adenylyltransferase subunit 1 (EFTu-like GTPase family)
MFTHYLNDKSELLRFSTSGSVDDGKSTLIGRLLYDTKLIFEDTAGKSPALGRHHRRGHRSTWPT